MRQILLPYRLKCRRIYKSRSFFIVAQNIKAEALMVFQNLAKNLKNYSANIFSRLRSLKNFTTSNAILAAISAKKICLKA